jgi:hypothetical protein
MTTQYVAMLCDVIIRASHAYIFHHRKFSLAACNSFTRQPLRSFNITIPFRPHVCMVQKQELFHYAVAYLMKYGRFWSIPSARLFPASGNGGRSVEGPPSVRSSRQETRSDAYNNQVHETHLSIDSYPLPCFTYMSLYQSILCRRLRF